MSSIDFIDNSQSNIIETTTEFTPGFSWQTLLLGRPLATADAPHQTIGKAIGLAVFSSDALSSVAYGPQELMLILAVAGSQALGYSMPIVIGIVILLAILTISYEQTIHAYPGGGGAYIVARDNLGELPAQTAGAALLTDYILTVAVSISSAVAQIVSAWPDLTPYRVEIAVGMVILIMLINLRGVRESGITFAIPTYFFLILTFITILYGLFQFATGSLSMVVDPPHLEAGALTGVSLALILRAFANGTSSLTGVEAISNGITAFKEPRSKNAGITLVWMAFILATMLLGITFLANQVGAIPSESETVVSQIARTVFGGRSLIYLAMIAATTIILVMACNTAFADFPRLGALHAGDGFLPRQLTHRGGRLVFSYGILTLAIIASLLVIVFQASVTSLLPLYAIGVFLSFTLSQAGMARRWWKSGHLKPGEEIVEPGSTVRYEKGWQWKMVVNAIGSLSSFVVMMIFAITKFSEGAWIIILITPILVSVFFAIHHHYKNLARQLSLEHYKPRRRVTRNRVIMPVSGIHQGTLEALRFARDISDDLTAVHVNVDPVQAKKIEAKWDQWGDGCRLVVLDSPYRFFIEPMLDYIEKVEKTTSPSEIITIVVPQFIPRNPLTKFLHARTADSLRKKLLNYKNIVIVEVPYQV